METSYLSANNKTDGKRKNQRNHRVPKNVYCAGQPCACLLDCIRHHTFLLFNIAAGLIFLVIALIGIYGVLKFLGCMRPCYQCKKCTYGLGRLSALYFGKRSLKDYKQTYGIGAAIFFYALLGPFPAAFLLVSTVQAFAVLKIAVLLCLLIISLYSALTWRTTRKL